MEDAHNDSRPSKRVKFDSTQVDCVIESGSTMSNPAEENGSQPSVAQTLPMPDDAAKEREVGIIAFVDESRHIFRGILKKRYTDFLVNEILLDGSVLRLRSMWVERRTARSDSDGTGFSAQGGAEQGNQVTTAPERTTDEGEMLKEDAINGKGKDPEDAKELGTAGQTVEVSEADRAKLLKSFNEDTVRQMCSLYQSILRNPEKKSREHPTVRTEFTSDRSLRSQIHQDIRRIFQSKIDSSTDKDGILVLTAAAPTPHQNRNRGWANKPNAPSRPNKLGWQERGGEYVHFTLYKENKDTLEVISYLTKQLKTNTKTFQFAGTKDRRAVTVQRASAYRVDAERLANLNRTLKYAAVGDYKYQKQGLELGDLSGNEFVVTLRDCQLEGLSTEQGIAERKAQLQSYLSQSLQQLREKGLLNFYGLQRFGTFSTRTDVVGLKILKDDFKGACDAILDFSPLAINTSESKLGALVSQDDRFRAEGINLWQTTGRIGDALDKIPRKFSAETTIIRHLGKHRGDFLGALLGIQRNLRLMYVHAYQSLVWNLAVSERWRLFGDKVVEGDLVLVHEHKDKQADNDSAPKQTVDADGEIVIEPSGDDRAHDKDDMFERGRALTPEEAQSGKYTIFDIVLPLPGFDVLYPANASGEWYKSFMASEAGGGLDPYDMRRKQRDFSLSGGYRKVLARIGAEWEARVEEYDDGEGEKQFVETDMERIKKSSKPERPAHSTIEEGAGNGTSRPTQEAGGEEARMAQSTPSTASKLAAVLKFQLGSSQYATMALRELSKGGIQAYKAEFVGGR